MANSNVQRKCPSCGTWNIANETHCSNCNELIDPMMKLEQEAESRERKRLEVPRGRLDLFIERFKSSKNPFVKLIYLVASALWFVYWVILSFILWLIAAGPG